MADSFEPGETAVMHRLGGEMAVYNEMDCLILSPLRSVEDWKGDVFLGHAVRTLDSKGAFVTIGCLKKKPPPDLPGDATKIADWDIISGPKLLKLPTT